MLVRQLDVQVNLVNKWLSSCFHFHFAAWTDASHVGYKLDLPSQPAFQKKNKIKVDVFSFPDFFILIVRWDASMSATPSQLGLRKYVVSWKLNFEEKTKLKNRQVNYEQHRLSSRGLPA